jgi:hypothetical protein
VIKERLRRGVGKDAQEDRGEANNAIRVTEIVLANVVLQKLVGIIGTKHLLWIQPLRAT